MFQDTTINQWAAKQGPISLRHAPRKDTRRHDLRAAEGIILGTMIGANLLVWGYVAIRWLIG